MLYTKTNFYKSQPPQLPQQFEGVLSRKLDYHKLHLHFPLPIKMTPCYILKRIFTKVNLLNYPNNLRGCYLANWITTKLHLHFPLPHYNDTMLYSKNELLQKLNNLGGGAISQTGLPQNSISTSPSPITMTPCYILKRTSVNLLNYPTKLGGAISQTGLPQNSISTSPSPITMTPCYILKRTFTKVNLLNYPNNLRGGAISQTGLPQNSISTSPSPIKMTPCYILKRIFTKVNLLNYPNNLRGCYLANWITTNSISTSPLPHYNDTVLYSKTNFYQSQPPQLL